MQNGSPTHYRALSKSSKILGGTQISNFVIWSKFGLNLNLRMVVV